MHLSMDEIFQNSRTLFYFKISFFLTPLLIFEFFVFKFCDASFFVFFSKFWWKFFPFCLCTGAVQVEVFFFLLYLLLSEKYISWMSMFFHEFSKWSLLFVAHWQFFLRYYYLWLECGSHFIFFWTFFLKKTKLFWYGAFPLTRIY